MDVQPMLTEPYADKPNTVRAHSAVNYVALASRIEKTAKANPKQVAEVVFMGHAGWQVCLALSVLQRSYPSAVLEFHQRFIKISDKENPYKGVVVIVALDPYLLEDTAPENSGDEEPTPTVETDVTMGGEPE